MLKFQPDTVIRLLRITTAGALQLTPHPATSMEWYYYNGNEEIGPYNPNDFRQLFNDGTLTGGVYVRSSGMNAPMPLTQVLSYGYGNELGLQSAVKCPTCGQLVRSDDLIPMNDVTLCPHCRDSYLQSMREGVKLTSDNYSFAGFLIRAGAYLIDVCILYALQMVLGFAFGFAMALGAENPDNLTESNIFTITVMVISYAIPLVYAVFFLGYRRTQATPGMLALGLRIIDKNGNQCTFLRAFGRYFVAILSALIFGIGYFMCAWDDEKQTLHDKIVGTYVIKK